MTILNADSVSVPEHNSSPIIKLCLSAFCKMTRNSDISTAKVDNPLNRLSLLNIREYIERYGLYLNELQGTYMPLCAIIITIPNARIKDVFPTAFVPYNKIPSTSSNSVLDFNESRHPKHKSLGT